MTSPMDVSAQVALDFQAQQLRMIAERLNYVRALLPSESVDWRGQSQELFDAGVRDLHAELAVARTLIESAESRTVTAAQVMSSRVG